MEQKKEVYFEEKLPKRVVLYGDIFLCNLDPVKGSEEGKKRPVIIVQNDVGNKYSPTTIVVPTTSHFKRKEWFHIEVGPDPENGLYSEGKILCEQIRTVDKVRLGQKIGHLPNCLMQKISDTEARLLCNRWH